jgi:hypothetical protein
MAKDLEQPVADIFVGPGDVGAAGGQSLGRLVPDCDRLLLERQFVNAGFHHMLHGARLALDRNRVALTRGQIDSRAAENE